ncbi:MAG: 16S rRNA processing protein RimM [Anaerolineales bacterium]|nr:16S rRNA processing protein RimM [Anaerolineales bacterium]
MSSPRRRQAAKRKQHFTGSPIPSEPVFVCVAILRRPHGLRGEVMVSLETDFPERLQTGTRLFLSEDYTPVTIASRRPHADGLLLSFEEFPTHEAVQPFRNEPLFVSIEDRPPLPAGEYYHHQLFGMHVLDEGGENLGQLADILVTGANDVYLVRAADGEEILLPAIPQVILSVDPAAKQMRVHLLPGLRQPKKPNPDS